VTGLSADDRAELTRLRRWAEAWRARQAAERRVVPVEHVAALRPGAVEAQRAGGWPDFHPEDFCHRCGRPNVVWSTPDAETWRRATRERERGVVDILCPSCFVELADPDSADVWEVRRYTGEGEQP